jgi:hypothetical protein
MAVGASFALSWYRHFDVLSENSLVFCDHAYVCRALAQHHGPQLGSPLCIARLPEHLQGDAVPSICLFEGEFTVHFEIEGVVLAHFHMLVLCGHFARDMQLARGYVKVC